MQLSNYAIPISAETLAIFFCVSTFVLLCLAIKISYDYFQQISHRSTPQPVVLRLKPLTSKHGVILHN